MTSLKKVLFAFAIVAFARWHPAWAHELEADRLTLVQRQDRLVEATWRIDLPASLHRMFASQEPYAEFLLRLGAGPPDEARQLLEKARQRWSAEIAFSTSDGAKGAWQRWDWPDAGALKAAAQERLMQRLAGGHDHPDPLTIQAQWLAETTPLTTLKVSVPPALRPLVIVSYRPRQSFMGANDPTVAIPF